MVTRAAFRLASDVLGAQCRVVLGISLGAISAVPAAALEGDLDGVVAMLGGADLPCLVSEGRYEGLEALRETVLSFAGSNRSDLTLVEPTTWASRLSRERVLLVRALWDKVVPDCASQRLREVLDYPEEVVYPSGHLSFGPFLPHAIGKAVDRAKQWCPVAEN